MSSTGQVTAIADSGFGRTGGADARGTAAAGVPEAYMSRIFISYNNEDLDVVQTLAADIAALSHTVWFDKELTGGQVWWDQILTQIRACDGFVFALSGRSLDSYPCRLEYEYGSNLGKPLLPVLVGDGVSPALLPPALSKVQFVDYRRHDKQALLAVMKALDGLPPAQAPADPPAPPPVPVSYLGELKDQIDSLSPLSFETQSALVFKLKEALRQPSESRDGRRLLEALRRRRDLFAVVAAEIDGALEHGPSGEPGRRRARPPAADAAPAAPSTRPAAKHAAEPPPPLPAPREEPAAAADPRDIAVKGGVDGVADVVRRVVKTREQWTLMATPHRHIAIQSDGQTITAVATFSDLAEIFASVGGKLKTAGWQKDLVRTAEQMLAALAVGVSFGTLLFNQKVRDASVANSMSRTWPARNGEARHLRTVATDILSALEIIAPNHKTVTARPPQGS